MTKTRGADIRSLLVALPLLLLWGCAPAIFALNAVGSGLSKATDYVLSNKVARTVNYDIDLMRESILIALEKMEVEVQGSVPIKNGEIITATAIDMEITVQLQKLTPSLTRLDITAVNGLVKRDKATAEEIIGQSIQVAKLLSPEENPDGALALSMAYPSPPKK